MATDLNAVVHIKDENGNVNNIFPATKIANVEGLTAALNAKANASDVTSGLAGKVDKETGKGLSANDYTTAEKNKLAGIEAQANKTTVDSALSTTSTNPVQNKIVKAALDEQTAGLATKADVSAVTAISNQVTANTSEIATQAARIDSIIALPDGATTADAELVDIRNRSDGSSVPSAGDAVRELNDLIYNYNSFNCLYNRYRTQTGTANGVTYTYKGDGVYNLDGSTDGSHASFYNIWDANSNNGKFPPGIKPGDTIFIDYYDVNRQVIIEVWTYVNGAVSPAKDYGTYESGFYTIPLNASNILIRFRVKDNASINNQDIRIQVFKKESMNLLDEKVSDIDAYGKYNILKQSYLATKNVPNCTYEGEGKYHVFKNESTQALIYNLYDSSAMFPDGIKAGSTYYFMFESTSIVLDVWKYVGTNLTRIEMFNASRYITIPSDATGLLIRFYAPVPSSTGKLTLDEIVDAPKIFTDIPFSKINAILSNYQYSDPNVLPDCDLDTLRSINKTFLMSDGHTYTNAPSGVASVGILVCQKVNTANVQIFYTWSTSDIFFRRCINDGAWGSWINKGNGGGGVTNEYTFNNYNDTYNVTATPSITADTNNYLAPTGTDEDVTASIETMLNTTGICRLGAGDYYVSNLDMPVNSAIIGSGAATRVILKSTGDYAIGANSHCTVKGLSLYGSLSDITVTETVGSRHGILWQGDYAETELTPAQPQRATIENVWIRNFTGGGITCYNTGYPNACCLNVTDVYIRTCSAGINISYWSEFHRFTNVHCMSCWYGCINNGGNNVFVNCDFSGNKMGCLMDNSQGQSQNNTHGSMIGCVFNHSDSNNGIGIKILGCANGFIFTGCQIFFSKTVINDSNGIVFSSCNYGQSNCDIQISGGGLILFSDNVHQNPPTITITGNDKVHFNNCYSRTTGEPITA